MEMILLFLGLIICGLLGYLVWQVSRPKPENQSPETQKLIEENARILAEKDQKVAELSKTTSELEREKKERSEFAGKNKILFAQKCELESEKKILMSEKEKLEKNIANFEAEKKQKEAEHSRSIEKLERAEKALADERNRIRREDETQQQRLLEAKNRQWTEHENLVISRLRETCLRPEIGFKFFENTALPPEFDGHFRPDGLVEFLGQYLYFDAKFSGQKDTNAYFSLQKLSEISKKCKNYKIYPNIFFVVPENRIAEIKNFVLTESGFTFFIISPSAIEPILANFRRVADYENLENFDPEDREKIVNLIANYDRHISFQNAVNILSAQKMVDLMQTKESLPSEIQSEISTQKNKMSDLKFTPSAVKNLSGNLENQSAEIEKLVAKKAPVEKPDLESAQNLLDFADKD